MSENFEHSHQTDFSTFVLASLGWLLLGLSAVYFLPDTWGDKALAAKWLLGLWFLCSLDLWVLAKTVLASLRWMGAQSGDGPNGNNGPSDKRVNYSFATLYWGAFKLICLGLLIVSLLEAQKAPMYSLVLGAGTLLIVPFIGGVFWNQRLLRDA